MTAFVSLLTQRCKASIPAGYYHAQALNTWILHQKDNEELKEFSPADNFFLERFWWLRRRHNRRKIVELWECLNGGVMSIEEAMAAAPIEIHPDRVRLPEKSRLQTPPIEPYTLFPIH